MFAILKRIGVWISLEVTKNLLKFFQTFIISLVLILPMFAFYKVAAWNIAHGTYNSDDDQFTSIWPDNNHYSYHVILIICLLYKRSQKIIFFRTTNKSLCKKLRILWALSIERGYFVINQLTLKCFFCMLSMASLLTNISDTILLFEHFLCTFVGGKYDLKKLQDKAY